MRNTIQNLDNLYSDYVGKFDPAPNTLIKYFSRFSLKCYYKTNQNGNTIYRYSLAHGWSNETKEMTRSQMIKALKNAIDNNQPLIKIGV